MDVKFNGFGFKLTEGKIYTVIGEHDSLYELECDDGKIYCRPKYLFEIVDNNYRKGILMDKESICAGSGTDNLSDRELLK